MGLSKRHLDNNQTDLPFSAEAIACEIKKQVPEVVFAYILGSAAEICIVKAHSDIDIAIYLKTKPEYGIYQKISRICEDLIGDVRCDLGILNDAEPVYCFEVIKGRILFFRDEEAWLKFYSRTCREYENAMFHYEKQRQYRIEAKNAV